LSSLVIAPYTNDARLKSRYLVATKFTEGHSRTYISRELQVSRRLVNDWVQLYLSGGFEALAIKKQSGLPAQLNEPQMKKIKDYVLEYSVKAGGGRLMAKCLFRQSLALIFSSRTFTAYSMSYRYLG